MTQPTPITAKQLEDFSAHYRADPVRKLATTALSKSEMSDVAYVSAGAAQMRHILFFRQETSGYAAAARPAFRCFPREKRRFTEILHSKYGKVPRRMV